MVKITDKLQQWCNGVYRYIPRARPNKGHRSRVKIVAHRGAWNHSDRLENTLAAFEECLNHNIWAIEFDIRWTKDNIPVVHHDESAQRVFHNSLKIREQNFLELRETLPQIPTLTEVVQSFGKKLHFMIELKTDTTPEQDQILADILKPLVAIEDYHFMSLQLHRFDQLPSFPHKSFVSIGRTNIGAIYKESLARDLGGCTGQYLLFSNGMKKRCHQQKIKVGTGFPDSKNLLYREVSRGVDWIFTNESVELSKLL